MKTIVFAALLALVSGWAASARGEFGKPQLRCGGYCLYIALKSLDFSVADYQAVESKLGQPSALGYSMEQLAQAARNFGAHAEGVETTLDGLSRRRGRFACIALLDKGHYVNLYDVADGRVYVVDPPNAKAVPADSFRVIWSGKALLISDHPLEVAPEGFKFGGWRLGIGVSFGAAAIVAVTAFLIKKHLK